MLLSPNPDLGRIARIVRSDDPRVAAGPRPRSRRPEFGTLILAFVRAARRPGGLLLEGWTAIDAQNKRTTVRLSNQRYNVAVPESAFTLCRAQEAQDKSVVNRQPFIAGDRFDRV